MSRTTVQNARWRSRRDDDRRRVLDGHGLVMEMSEIFTLPSSGSPFRLCRTARVHPEASASRARPALRS